jgi:hypothetical protein
LEIARGLKGTGKRDREREEEGLREQGKEIGSESERVKGNREKR